MRTAFVVTLFAATSLFLGACSHYSDDLASLDNAMKAKPQPVMAAATATPQEIAPAAGAGAVAVPAVPMNDYLARDYYDLAKYENDKAYDYKASKIYTEKAMIAAKGERVMPSAISSYDLPDERVAELTEARKRLAIALTEQSVPENQQALAKAQTGFDCWLERAEEADKESHYADCKAQFEQSMASLMMPAAGSVETPAPTAPAVVASIPPSTVERTTTVYDIKFVRMGAVPDDASRKYIDHIAQTLNAPENAVLKVAVTAPAGDVGTARANSVRQSLIIKGVAPARISVTAPSAGSADEGVKVAIIGAQPQQIQPQPYAQQPAPAAIVPSAGN